MNVVKSYKKVLEKKLFFIIFLILSLVFLSIVSINIGSSDMTIMDSILTLMGKSSNEFNHIIFNIRLPRILGGIFIGMTIALSGLIIQSVLNNPLASPSTLGISNASVLGANISLILFAKIGIESSMFLTGLSSFIAAVICTFIIIMFSSMKKSSNATVLLAGIALNFLFSALTILIQFFSTDEEIASAVSWTFGDLGRININEVKFVAIVLVVSALIIYKLRWKYNAMDMGESTAHSLGINIKTMRNLSIIVASLNTGIGVAYVGMIGFVGLLAPQISKRIIGEDKRFLIPASMLLGSIIVLVSDCIGRVAVKPHILPIGAITSLFGAPFFIYILFKEN
ncbi:iron ABC transporter permease [Helcococcus ovis]|uniref:Iron ABC transporter permease n=1 Tax=Helcococcus ovis TaxID=72026 RepID=A0A4R9C298_9FIRM|nr:iron ABC transporter permease [Helcococcus ovis]TFF66006.1 iron ABC transporter permease [Helcococcus ovis]TFF67002.1 iron ABC transporter permease [Helcococcus ovis]